MKRFLLCLVLVVLVIPMSAHAQDDPECEPDLTAVTDLFTEAQTALDDGDIITALDTLREIRLELSLIESQCSTLDFEGDKAIVSDPIEIPEGIYRVTATTDGYLIAKITILEGECGEGSGSILSKAFFLLSEGQATEGSQVVFTSLGCEVLFEYASVTAPYAITWEKIK